MGRLSRLETALILSMAGCLTDWAITQWILNYLTGYAESNQNLLPAVGLPVLVLNLILADKILPRRIAYDRVIYTIALLQWTGPIHNTLVYLNVIRGLDFFSAVLPTLAAIYLCLYIAPVIRASLSRVITRRQVKPGGIAPETIR